MKHKTTLSKITLMSVLLFFSFSCKKEASQSAKEKTDIYKNIAFIKDWIPTNENLQSTTGPKTNAIRNIVLSWVAEGSVYPQGKTLTVGFYNGPSSMDASAARDQVFAGISAWFRINVPNLNISILSTTDVNSANVKVGWYKGNHGDGANNAFDGPGKVLAHATAPTSGIMHFDDDENWSASTFGPVPGTIDLASVAAHEFGHIIGLDHSECPNATMTANYFGLGMRTLSVDDVVGSRSLYGNNPNYESSIYPFMDTDNLRLGATGDFVLFYAVDISSSPMGGPQQITYNPSAQPPFRYSGTIRWEMPPGIELVSGQGTAKATIRVNGQNVGGKVFIKAYISDCNATIEIKSLELTLKP